MRAKWKEVYSLASQASCKGTDFGLPMEGYRGTIYWSNKRGRGLGSGEGIGEQKVL